MEFTKLGNSPHVQTDDLKQFGVTKKTELRTDALFQ